MSGSLNAGFLQAWVFSEASVTVYREELRVDLVNQGEDSFVTLISVCSPFLFILLSFPIDDLQSQIIGTDAHGSSSKQMAFTDKVVKKA